MKLNKFWKKLRREATGNPKKAGLLAGLALVAMYFWAPLVAKWFGSGETTPMTSASKATPTSVAPMAAAMQMPGSSIVSSEAVRPKENSPARHSWKELAQWIDNDPRAQTAGPLASGNDPFSSPVVVAAKPKPMQKAIEPEFTVQGLNLILTTTIVGPHMHVARINGKTYTEGRTIEVPVKVGKPIAFKLTEVGPRSVILERNDKKYELTIQSSKNSGSIELLGYAP